MEQFQAVHAVFVVKRSDEGDGVFGRNTGFVLQKAKLFGDFCGGQSDLQGESHLLEALG